MSPFRVDPGVESFAFEGLTLPTVPDDVVWCALHAVGGGRYNPDLPDAVRAWWGATKLRALRGYGLVFRPSVSREQYDPVLPPRGEWRFRGGAWCVFWRAVSEPRLRVEADVRELYLACARFAQPVLGRCLFPWDASQWGSVDTAVRAEVARLEGAGTDGELRLALAAARVAPEHIESLGAGVWLSRPPEAAPTVLTTYCAACADGAAVQRQVRTPSGVTCAQGHGGADGVSYEDAVARGLLANSREP